MNLRSTPEKKPTAFHFHTIFQCGFLRFCILFSSASSAKEDEPDELIRLKYKWTKKACFRVDHGSEFRVYLQKKQLLVHKSPNQTKWGSNFFEAQSNPTPIGATKQVVRLQVVRLQVSHPISSMLCAGLVSSSGRDESEWQSFSTITEHTWPP